MQSILNQRPTITTKDFLHHYLIDKLQCRSDGSFSYQGIKGKVVQMDKEEIILFGTPIQSYPIHHDLVDTLVNDLNHSTHDVNEIMNSHKDLLKIKECLPWAQQQTRTTSNSNTTTEQRNTHNSALVGDRDLYPTGNFAPMPMGPLNGGGMIMGPNHPIFNQNQEPGHRGDYEGYMSPLSVPPGARFDPIFPDGGPSNSLGHGRRSGEPNPDEFKPPNSFGNTFGGL